MGFEDDADDEPFIQAYERAAMARVVREVGPILRDGGIGEVDRRHAFAERQRVAGIIDRDRGDRAREQMRFNARAQVANGEFANIADTVLEPTPEWMAKGETRAFTPRLHDGPEQTVRTVRGVRRVLTPIPMRLYAAGSMTEETLKACLWYRLVHSQAGLDGRFSTSRYGNDASLGASKSKTLGGAAGHIPMTLVEAEARRHYRAARDVIPAHLLKLFEAVVLDDIPLRRVARFVRARNARVLVDFRRAAEKLREHCQSVGIEHGAKGTGLGD